MKNINLVELLPYVALIISVTSPILTVLINNHHQLKMRSAEFYDIHRAETIEKYIHSVNMLIQSSHCDGVEKYAKYSVEVRLYIPQSQWNILDSIDSSLNERDFSSTNIHLKSLCKYLSKKPPRFKY